MTVSRQPIASKNTKVRLAAKTLTLNPLKRAILQEKIADPKADDC